MAASFTWKGTNSETMGVVVETFPPRMRAKARTTTITIPGRAGGLIVPEGVDAYDNLSLAVNCVLLSSADIDAVAAWLTGSGMLIFSNDATHAYSAQLVDAISMAKILAVRQDRRFTATFTAYPFRYQAVPDADTVLTESGDAITNVGTARSLPLISVAGTGDVVLMVSGQMVELTLGENAGIVLDCDAQIATSLDGDTNLSALVAGDYPSLAVGANAISWTGTVTNVMIKPRWRWI